jgi:hypothetical protein
MTRNTTISFLRKLGLSTKEYSLKNITRIGKKRATNGWWVRINNEELKCSKTFYDHNFDSPKEAFLEAAKYRDQQPKNIKSNTGYEFISITVKDKIYPTLKVTLKPYEKAFTIRAKGYREALFLAINFRNKRMKLPPVTREELSIEKGLIDLKEKLDPEIYQRVELMN